MYQKLSEKLYATLSPLVGINIKMLDRVEIPNPEIFPFAVIIEDDTAEEETIFDSVSNIAIYRFKIRVVNSFADDNLRQCADKVRTIVDEILAKIRSVRVWDDCVQKAETSVRWGYMNEEKQRVAEIGVSFLVLVDVL